MRSGLVLALVLVTGACGDGGKGDDSGPPGTGTGAGTGTGTGTGSGVVDLEGAWSVRSMTTTSGVSEDGVGVIGVLDITGTSIASSIAGVSNGVPSGAVGRADVTFTVDGSRIVADGPDGVQVFVVTGFESERTLAWDATDSRNTITANADTAEELVLDRLITPTALGRWDGTLIKMGPTSQLLGTCLAFGTGTWTITEMDLDIEDNGLVAITSTQAGYSDDACTVPAGTPDVWTSEGFWRETGPLAELWQWSPNDAAGTWDKLQIALDGTDLGLQRTDCRPTPDCLSSGFTEIDLVAE